MKLYEATYEYQVANSDNLIELSLHILAPDFQTATKLATTNELICKWFNSVDFLANMNLANMLLKVELIANDVLQE